MLNKFYYDMKDEDAKNCIWNHYKLTRNLDKDELAHLVLCYLMQINPDSETLQKAKRALKLHLVLCS